MNTDEPAAWAPHSKYRHVFGIIRIDGPLPSTSDRWDHRVAGTKAYWGRAQAEREAARLQEGAPDSVTYIVVVLRVVPE